MSEYRLDTLLRASAEKYPELVAAVDSGRCLPYGELESRANQLARLLVDEGVARGDRVGLFLDKSLESLVAIYAVLKAGAAYVPFDPQAPLARLTYIARNADIRCLLTGIEKAEDWERLVHEGAPLETVVALNGEKGDAGTPGRKMRLVAADALAAYAETPFTRKGTSSDLAYILYTSGSTGDPKGVMLSHANALAFVDWAVGQFAVTSSDRLSSHAPLYFDLSIFDIFAASKAGASVVLVPPHISIFPVEVARFIEQNEISIWYSVPSILSLLVLRGNLKRGRLQSLRTILFAGEVFPTKYLFRLMELLPHVRFYNLYGPTETNVCTWYEVPPPSDGRVQSIPIGKAISNVDVFAVTDEERVAGPGEVGELCVKGPTVMRGYWGDPEGSARPLVTDRFGGSPTEPVYRTGDLVRREEDGNYVFLGRRDAQIKSRGYRIELGEIESALYAHPSVVECAVSAIPDEVITNRIRADVVVRGDVDEQALVEFCSKRIPRYMIPEIVEFRAELPRTSTGKIDRRRLIPTGGR